MHSLKSHNNPIGVVVVISLSADEESEASRDSLTCRWPQVAGQNLMQVDLPLKPASWSPHTWKILLIVQIFPNGCFVPCNSSPGPIDATSLRSTTFLFFYHCPPARLPNFTPSCCLPSPIHPAYSYQPSLRWLLVAPIFPILKNPSVASTVYRE